MKKLLTVLYTWCLLLLLGCGVLLLVTAPKEATPSEGENRMLEAFPSADAQTLLSGEFSDAFERYLSDRFFLRDRCIALSGAIRNRFSLLSKADTLKLSVMDARVDNAAEDKTADETPVPAAETPPVTAAPTATPTPTETPTPVPAETPDAEPETPSPTERAAALIRVKEALPSPMPRTPLYEYSSGKDPDKDETADVFLIGADGSRSVLVKYRKWHIRDAANMFNRLAALLPENGHVYVSFVQRSEYVMQYALALDKYTAYESEVEDYLEPLLDERISVFRAADILDPHIRAGEYVYFYTDHHWTPLGAYYLHKAMIEAQGKKAVPYTENRLQKQNGAFRGLNADAVEPLLPPGTKDVVEEVEPSLAYDFYRVENLNELTPYPLNKPDARGYQALLWLNMRPWKMIRTYENNGRKMLLICDSMGMAFAPFMAYYYDEVHIVRPHTTYYSVEEAGGTIKEYIDYWGIDDIYVVQSNFFTTDLYRAELFKSIGDGK